MSARRGGAPLGPAWEGPALVLSTHDAGDHRIVRLLTADDTLVPGIVRFGRRRNRKQEPAQPLTQVNARFARRDGADLAQISSIVVERPFAGMARDVVRFGAASVMAELVLHLVPDEAVEPGLFALLHRAWATLDDPSQAAVEEIVLLFELRLLDGSGVMPPIPSLGTLSESARATLTGWREGRWARLSAGDARAVASALDALVIGISARPLRSRAVLEQLLGR